MKKNIVRSLFVVGIFAITMAYLESATVVYLRRMVIGGSSTMTLSYYDPHIALIELGRETATLIMLLLAGWLAGRNSQSRFGFAIFAFGIWDIFYYVWLRLFSGWPGSVMDPDLLFLIPLPWWGPVLSPVLIAGVMILTGARMAQLDDQDIRVQITVIDWVIFGSGILVMLYCFMSDALASLPTDAQTLSRMEPGPFKWPVFLTGLGMALFSICRVFFSVIDTGRDDLIPAYHSLRGHIHIRIGRSL